MAEAAMKEELVSGEAAQDATQERERSTIVFPYLSLDVAVEIAKGVHSTGGQQSQMDQLAAYLNESANGGSFRTKIVTARIFGLVKYSTGTVSLTSLGSRLTDPDQEKVAKAEAFLHVPLYRRIYEDFKGLVLPPTPAALESVMVTLGVAPKQRDKARQVFLRSAQQAGFFAYGTTKLVYPTLGSTEAATNKPKAGEGEREHSREDTNPRNGGGSGGGGRGQYHPFIQGLLQTLPEPKTEWPLAARKKWLQSALSIFDVIYESAEDSQSLVVKLEKNSAM